MKIELIKENEKSILKEHLKHYLLELNDSDDYPYLDLYWKEKDRIPLKIINENQEWIGFALINNYTILKSNTISIAEFYIISSHRNQGIGSLLSKYIFETYNGKWEVRTQITNKNAIQFWKKTIQNISENKFESQIINDELIFSFEKEFFRYSI